MKIIVEILKGIGLILYGLVFPYRLYYIGLRLIETKNITKRGENSMIDASNISIKDLVKDKRVVFSFYRSGELWYETTDGFLFPVPISDIGDATFLKEDKAILFMRYIRKYRDELDEG